MAEGTEVSAFPITPEPGTRLNVMVSIATAAKRLGVSTKTIRRRIACGHFPRVYRVGSMIRIPESDVLALLTPAATGTQDDGRTPREYPRQTDVEAHAQAEEKPAA